MINAAIDRHHWAEAIADLLREMPQRCAAAVRMSYFEHLPEHEIAVRLGTSLADARKALACGLGILGRAQSATPHV